MLRFVLRQLRAASGRAVVLGLGLLIAGAGFSVLSSVAVSSAVRVRGTLSRNFAPAYDVLVRPRGAATALERSEGLVDDGFLSDLYGGISTAQWQRILRLPGVGVAAPVENIGYTLAPVTVDVDLRSLVGAGSQQLFRVVPSFEVHGGLASYPSSDQYLYWSRDRWVRQPGQFAPALRVPGRRAPLRACRLYVHGQDAAMAAGTFDTRAFELMTCAGFDQPRHDAKMRLDFYVPVLLAAIDPAQESKLVGLPSAMVRGSYLRESEGSARLVQSGPKDPGQPTVVQRAVPFIVSSRTFLDEALRVRVQRLRVPEQGAQLAERLAARGGGDYADALRGPTVLNRTYSTAGLYRKAIASHVYFLNYWTSGPVRYRVLKRRTVAPEPVTDPESVWEPTGNAMLQGSSAPPGADATQYRRLTPYDGTANIKRLTNGDNLQLQVSLQEQGVFDPDRLRGFAPFSKVPLGTFFPPTVTGATTSSRRLLHNTPLGPTTDLAGYLAQPPLLLTTLKAATRIFDPRDYTGDHPRRAPIAAIQVRVSGLHGASRASITRVERVAAEIVHATGLQVDITAGSSPTPVRVDLPNGGFGQPALDVQQGWVKKGVATVVLDASDAKNTALFALVLLVAALFVANASSAAVRQRRSEIATLATLGWERRQVFAVVLGEVGVIGLVAGLAGAALAAAIIAIAGLDLSVVRVLSVLPASVLVALLAGALPAYSAARLSPMAGLVAPVRSTAAVRTVRSVTGLAWVNLNRLPGRTVLGGFGLVVGVGAFAFLLAIQHAFRGAVAGDVLGNHIDVEVQGSDYAAVALILLLAVGSVADVLIMNLRERAGEFATLQAAGWEDRSLRQLVITEGVTLGSIAALAGALIGLAAAWTLGADPARVVPVTAIAFLAGVGVCSTAVMPAVAVLMRKMPATTLAANHR